MRSVPRPRRKVLEAWADFRTASRFAHLQELTGCPFTKRLELVCSAHHERIASTTAEDRPGCSSVGRVLALEARCRRFESCHPDHPTIATHAILTQPFKGWCQSGNGRGCNPRACKFIGGSTPPQPTTIRAVGETVNAASSKEVNFQVRILNGPPDHCPAGEIGIRSGLRNRFLPVRVRGGAPEFRRESRHLKRPRLQHHTSGLIMFMALPQKARCTTAL